MLEEVWSGGQVGADIAGLRAAKAVGLRTGGWMPRGFYTIAGKRPEYALLYQMQETATHHYPDRTRRNVRDTDGTLFLGDDPESKGAVLTAGFCARYGRPFWAVTAAQMLAPETPQAVQEWLKAHQIRHLNIAGNRSASEEIVETFLTIVFQQARLVSSLPLAAL